MYVCVTYHQTLSTLTLSSLHIIATGQPATPAARLCFVLYLVVVVVVVVLYLLLSASPRRTT